jgi:carboxypeptidase family protein
MTARKDSLDELEITSPCNADWNEMNGTEQIRYCTECNKYVYNLSAMTRREAEELAATSRGQMCTRMIRDLGGRTITVDSLPPVRLLGWRPGPIASTVVSTILSIAPSAAALSRTPRASSQQYSQNESARKASRSVPAITTGALTGTVSDDDGAPIKAAIVTLTSEAAGDVLSELTSEAGEFRFDGLSARTYICEIHAKGYERSTQHGLELQSGEVHRMDVVMEKEVLIGGATGVPAQPLRALYLQSDRVVVATVGKTTTPKKSSDDGSVRTSLTVSQTIKGDGHKPIVDVFQWDLAARRNGANEGDTVLAFLQRKEDGRDGYEPIYGSSSIKNLSESDLGTYLRRLAQLKELITRSNADPKDITEWLVQCAEDPATRWEGTFELALSAWQEKRRRQEIERLDSEPNEGSPTAGTDRSTPDTKPPSKKARDSEPTFAALLSGDQKERLMNVLLTSTNMDDVAFELIDVAKSWNDKRLLPFLVSYLDQAQDPMQWSVHRVLMIVVELVGDETTNNLLQQYREPDSFVKIEFKQSDEDSVSSDDEKKAGEKEDATDQAVKPRSSRDELAQARAAILKKFVAAAQAKIKQDSNH